MQTGRCARDQVERGSRARSSRRPPVRRSDARSDRDMRPSARRDPGSASCGRSRQQAPHRADDDAREIQPDEHERRGPHRLGSGAGSKRTADQAAITRHNEHDDDQRCTDEHDHHRADHSSLPPKAGSAAPSWSSRQDRAAAAAASKTSTARTRGRRPPGSTSMRWNIPSSCATFETLPATSPGRKLAPRPLDHDLVADLDLGLSRRCGRRCALEPLDRATTRHESRAAEAGQHTATAGARNQHLDRRSRIADQRDVGA